jgi:very-short-patch-repair endonuclease
MHITIQRDHARAMRRAPTEAERKLWGALRKCALHGYRFQRQVEIGRYIVDFLCRREKLIIEIDGATHGDTYAVRYDQRRDAYLEAKGYRIFRATNDDVFCNLDGVLYGLVLVLQERVR